MWHLITGTSVSSWPNIPPIKATGIPLKSLIRFEQAQVESSAFMASLSRRRVTDDCILRSVPSELTMTAEKELLLIYQYY